MSNLEVIEKVTNKICDMMESGVNPWVKPWGKLNNGKPMPQYFAYNFVSKKAYEGMNQLLLYPGYYATFEQIKKLGGHINKGAKSHFVVKFKWVEYECDENTWGAYQKDEEEKWFHKVPFIRYFNVFNLKDTSLNDEIEYPQIDMEHSNGGDSKIEEVENVLNAYIQKSHLTYIETMCDSAYYSPTRHMVNLPMFSQFANVGEYYSTKCHELVHSTGGHFKREGIEHFDGFGSQNYSREELIAEMGSAYCCGYFGISTEGTLMNSASYLKNWASHIRENKDLRTKIFGIVTEATKAFKYICGIEGGMLEEEEE